MIRDQDALDYHEGARNGKIEVASTKPCITQRDLSLAYTPGVAVPCRAIHKNPADVYRYTAKGNLVAVISNGTAVLGLGDIGPHAGKPVMEGKGVLFKRFADIDVFDLELAVRDPEEFIRVVRALEPTFGGINLEDIAAPDCFIIEERLQQELDIPVFHDDQHGTAIISGAALLNALELVEKDIDKVRVVFNGAGAAGIACARYYLSLGLNPDNLILCDSAGVVYRGRERKMNPYKQALAADTTARTLADALDGADVFVGLSIADCVTRDMVRSMAYRPIVLAMANPDPEITWEEATAARSDVIMATGRSDYPNQVNNVLGFPFIFRGALDVRARAINEQMKLAATRALADLARADVPDSVMKAYGLQKLHFGPDYLIPKPFDPRVLVWEAAAVARAAIDTGVARVEIDLDEYKSRLESRLSRSHEVMRIVVGQARRRPKRVVFPEGEHPKVLRAARILVEEKIARPILLGSIERIGGIIDELDLDLKLSDVTVKDPSENGGERYWRELYGLRQRKGMTEAEARKQARRPMIHGALMVRLGDADALVAGVSQNYPETIRPALQIIQMRRDVSRVAGMYLMVLRDRVLCFADPTVNVDPTAEALADIAILAAEEARKFQIDPRIAMVSFSNFGSTSHPRVDKVRQATETIRRRAPELVVDGEVQADIALTPELMQELYPFSQLAGGANVLIFPDLQSANAAYKLVRRLAGAEAIGPILMGMSRPVHLLQVGSDVQDIVNVAALAVVDAQGIEDAASAVAQPQAAERGAKVPQPV